MIYNDVAITDRVIEEISKLGKNAYQIGKVVGCSTALAKSWLDGVHLPAAYYLRRLHEIGCDVLYILTGTHYNLVGGDTDV